MRTWRLAIFTACLLGLGAALAAPARPVDKGPADITLDTNHAGKKAVYPHRMHQELPEVKGDCTLCHHTSKPDERPKPCSACHAAAKDDPANHVVGFQTAFHKRCLECHRKHTEKPTLKSCNTCHK